MGRLALKGNEMSGGSFYYLYNLVEEMSINPLILSNLTSMAEWLEEPEQNKKEAAIEIKKVLAELEQINERLREISSTAHFCNVLHAAEWWASRDISETEFDMEWLNYLLSKRKRIIREINSDHTWDMFIENLGLILNDTEGKNE